MLVVTRVGISSSDFSISFLEGGVPQESSENRHNQSALEGSVLIGFVGRLAAQLEIPHKSWEIA